MMKCCVLFEVRTGFLSITSIYTSFDFKRLNMEYIISPLSLNSGCKKSHIVSNTNHRGAKTIIALCIKYLSCDETAVNI
jgi:hypothetical protein